MPSTLLSMVGVDLPAPRRRQFSRRMESISRGPVALPLLSSVHTKWAPGQPYSTLGTSVYSCPCLSFKSILKTVFFFCLL